ncbi:hypothetical protein AMECASPLE_035704 [Ameca splendens]|uniref:Uncharacterized protein n=1 Tax=Ameca splendens TaxID=208324 RepID=A0ABV0XWP5_9TELE
MSGGLRRGQRNLRSKVSGGLQRLLNRGGDFGLASGLDTGRNRRGLSLESGRGVSGLETHHDLLSGNCPATMTMTPSRAGGKSSRKFCSGWWRSCHGRDELGRNRC